MLKGPGPLADKREQLSYASLPKTNMAAGKPVRNAKPLENGKEAPPRYGQIALLKNGHHGVSGPRL